MLKRLQLYDAARCSPGILVNFALLLVCSVVSAQDGLEEFADPIKSALSLVTNVLGPAIAIAGLVFAGVTFFNGETGRPFKIAIGVIFGGVLISSAQSIWTGFFHGVSVGG
jgi:type IV secretory pathway VirB2 component (pilin)